MSQRRCKLLLFIDSVSSEDGYMARSCRYWDNLYHGFYMVAYMESPGQVSFFDFDFFWHTLVGGLRLWRAEEAPLTITHR